MNKKRQNGLTAEKVQELRRDIRDAVQSFGEERVASALKVETIEIALDSITVNMPKRVFGEAANAIRVLTKPAPRGNKYAHLAPQRNL